MDVEAITLALTGYGDGNGDGEAIDYTPEEQPFPWVALLVGVGAVLLAARR